MPLSITAANVAKGTDTQVNNQYNAGATITAGQVVYLDTTTSTWKLAQCDGTALESGVGTTVGIALHGSLSGQPLAVLVAGTITIGATTAVGVEYCISPTAGGIDARSDLVSTNKYTRLGYGTTTAIIQLDIRATGLAIA